MKIDNENVRASNWCPLCEGQKERGLIACWPCYHIYGLRYGNEKAEARMKEANEEDQFEKFIDTALGH